MDKKEYMAKGNIDGTGTGIGFMERILALVNKYHFKDFLKAFTVLILIGLGVWFISNPGWVFERYDKWAEQKHERMTEIRRDNSERINLLLDKALYRMGADRIVLLELHNGTTGASGLPFEKCSATYEAVDYVRPVSNQYQNVNISLYPFTKYLKDNGYWQGKVEDLISIDKSLSYRMMSNGVESLAGCLIEGVDKPLAFLFVTYGEEGCSLDSTAVRNDVRHVAMELALLLETQK